MSSAATELFKYPCYPYVTRLGVAAGCSARNDTVRKPDSRSITVGKPASPGTRMGKPASPGTFCVPVVSGERLAWPDASPRDLWALCRSLR